MKLGKINKLTIKRESENGLYLSGDGEDEVLLPNRYVQDYMQINKQINVFLYTDSEDRLVATTERPIAFVDEFGYLEVKDTTNFGAFMDWGLSKDLFVPKNRQKTPFRVGEKRVVRVVEDELTNRLIGVEKIKQFLSIKDPDFIKDQEVDILIIAKTPLGFKVIINNSFLGMIYHNEIFEKLFVGFKRKAYIKNIREDKKIDLTLMPKDKDKEICNIIINKLTQNSGAMPFNYKSNSEDIVKNFQISKKILNEG